MERFAQDRAGDVGMHETATAAGLDLALAM